MLSIGLSDQFGKVSFALYNVIDALSWFGYCNQSDNVISLPQPQSNYIKWKA
jgi:hypothetical protein